MLVAASVGLLAAVSTAAILGSLASPLVVTGLTAPRGLTPTDEGGLLIAEVGTGRLLEMSPDGELRVIADGLPYAPISGPGQYPAGPSAVIMRDGAYFYVIGEHFVPGFSELYRLRPGGDPEPVTGQEIVNRFGTNPLTNPYDLVSVPDGGFLVSDSGINAILHISEKGEISEYVAFPGLENPQPLNGFSEIDVVPTGLDRGPDGAVYVASLTGFPYPKGAASVYRLENLNGDESSRGEYSVFAEGFTAATDLAFDEDGSLLVVEFSSDLASLEEGDVRDAERFPGRLVRWQDGEMTVVEDGLVSPTSVAVADGRIFVSEEFAGRITEVPADRPVPGPSTWIWASVIGLFAMVLVHVATRSWLGRRERETDPEPTVRP